MIDYSFIPSKVRGSVYLLAVVVGVVVESATRGFAAVGHGTPVWVVFLSGAQPTLLTAAGAIALSHVTSAKAAELANVLPALTAALPTSTNDADQPDGDPTFSGSIEEPEAQVPVENDLDGEDAALYLPDPEVTSGTPLLETVPVTVTTPAPVTAVISSDGSATPASSAFTRA